MNPISSSDQIFVIKESFYKKLTKPFSSLISLAKKRFSSQTEENRGFLYKIQTPKGKTVGYLLGTMHLMDLDWPGLNERTQAKIAKSSKVIFENLLGFEEESKVELMKLGGPSLTFGVDYAVYDLAQDKIIEGFETFEEAETIISTASVLYGHLFKFTTKEVKRECLNWKRGINLGSSSYDLVHKEKDFRKKEAYIYGLNYIGAKRTNKWIDKLDAELKSAKKDHTKVFVAVGANHFPDFREFDLDIPNVKYQFKGLITLLEERGWSVIKVSE